MTKIQYEDIQRPEMGQVVDILPGIKWLRMPLPIVLDSINLWMLRESDGWTVIDTGLGIDSCIEVWERVLQEHLDGLPVVRVIVTHMHPDHAGLAGWFCDRYDIDLWISRSEYLTCRVLATDQGPAPERAIRFYRAAGFTQTQLDRYKNKFGMFGRAIKPLPPGYVRLKDGDELQIGHHTWRLIEGSGHSPEHICLFSPKLNVIFSGDQILPTISSNVSVFPTEADADPLGYWLDSCKKLSEVLPEDVLVLPAHGKPFRGAAVRLRTLIEEHEDGLQKLAALCQSPQRVVDVFPALFRGTISASNLVMATGEALAHLNYLLSREQMVKSQDSEGVDWYCA